MDRKIKSLIIALTSLITFSSCEPSDIDGLPSGKHYYMIVNKTNHNVRIESSPASAAYARDTLKLCPNDSIILNSVVSSFSYAPFHAGIVHLVFNDTLYYLCPSYKGINHPIGDSEMIFAQGNYSTILSGPDIYLYRYEITEEDYEYAKAHPYKLEEE